MIVNFEIIIKIYKIKIILKIIIFKIIKTRRIRDIHVLMPYKNSFKSLGIS